MDGASPHLARLAARPRPAGGPAAAEAREYCAQVLRDLGFSISEQSFEFSAFPGAWAAPVAGASTSLACIALFVGRHVRWMTVVAIVFVVVVSIALRWLAGSGVLAFGAMRRTGVNLEAVRGNAKPSVWLVAHIDSKWQPVSMIMRIVGVLVSSMAGFSLLLTNLLPGVSDRTAAVLLIVAWLGSIPLMLSIVRDHGPGTSDNASGVASVLEAAAHLGTNESVGILITDAEEFALAGIRAWMRGRTPGVALNCDTIDDDGAFTIMLSRSTRGPGELVSRLVDAANELDERMRVISVLPGVLADSVALAQAGWCTMTLSRGSIRTLQRIHTSRDSLAEMRGTAIPMAGKILSRAALDMASREGET